MSWSVTARRVSGNSPGPNPSPLSYYLNDAFVSSDPLLVAGFYDRFRTLAELVDWMQRRPSSEPRIREIPGSAEVVFVVPTADVDGPMARHCRDEAFRGSRILFLESPSRPDPFYNIGYYLNRGIARALELNPHWIVLSGDDVRRLDPPEVLTGGLARLDPSRCNSVFTIPAGHYHSVASQLSRQRWTRRFLLSWSTAKRAVVSSEERFGADLHAPRSGGYQSLLFQPGYRHWSMASFGIFSAPYLRSLGPAPFDPAFGLGGSEDVEFCLRLNRRADRLAFLPFRIGERVGATLGTGDARRLREVAGLAYLNYLVRRDPTKYFPEGYDYLRLVAGPRH